MSTLCHLCSDPNSELYYLSDLQQENYWCQECFEEFVYPEAYTTIPIFLKSTKADPVVFPNYATFLETSSLQRDKIVLYCYFDLDTNLNINGDSGQPIFPNTFNYQDRYDAIVKSLSKLTSEHTLCLVRPNGAYQGFYCSVFWNNKDDFIQNLKGDFSSCKYFSSGPYRRYYLLASNDDKVNSYLSSPFAYQHI